MINLNLILVSLVLLVLMVILEIKNHKYKNGLRNLSLAYGIGLLIFGFWHAIEEHASEFSNLKFTAIFASGIITYLLITYFSHKHTKNTEIKGIVTAEFLHGLTDGAVIGMAYAINPLFGYGTLLSVISHEIPKIIGTFFLIRSQVKTLIETLKYSLCCQLGLPIAAVSTYLLGSKINPEYHEWIEAIALASLLAIIFRLTTKAVRLYTSNNNHGSHNH